MLRAVAASDLPAFFAHQSDPAAVAMAAFPARDRTAFDAHWERLLADPAVITRTIECGGAVAGNIGAWLQEGRVLVGFVLGREFWGRGIATGALSEFLELVAQRPLHALVAEHNRGSIRVLEKCGFCAQSRTRHPGEDFDELLMELAGAQSSAAR